MRRTSVHVVYLGSDSRKHWEGEGRGGRKGEDSNKRCINEWSLPGLLKFNPDMDPLRDGALRIVPSKGREAGALTSQLTFMG